MDAIGAIQIPEWLRLVLQGYLPQVPLWAVWAVAVIFAIVRWRRHPAVSLVVLIAGVVDVGMGLISPLVYPLFFRILDPSSELAWTLMSSGLNFVIWGVHTVARILLLVAVFGWRGRPAAAAVAVEPPQRA